MIINIRRLLVAASLAALSAMVLLLVPLQQKVVRTHGDVPAVDAKPPAMGRLANLERKAAREEYFSMIYGDPVTGRIPEGIRARELEFARRLPQQGQLATKTGSVTIDWKEAGPTDVGGRTRGFAVDVTNQDVLLAGGASGGIWKSTDRGASWILVSEDHLSITALAQDTRTGYSDIWYACTGELRSTFHSNSEIAAWLYGTGFYKSTDGGDSWIQIQSGGNPIVWDSYFNYTVDLAVSPVTGAVFVIDNSSGILRSTNGGRSFSSVFGEFNSHPFGDLDIDAGGNIIVVLNGLGSTPTTGIFRSTDDGVTWSPVHQGAFPDPFNDSTVRSVLSLAPSNPDVAYIMTAVGGERTVTGGIVEDVRFHKLTISTGTYEDRTANLPIFLNDAGDILLGSINTQYGYNMTIGVHPTDENHVFIGATSLFRSRDGFATPLISKEDSWIGGYASADTSAHSYANNHPDHHALVFDPHKTNRLYNGHDGGLSVAEDVTPEGAVTWSNLNNGYNVTQFYTVSMARAAGDDRILGGAQDNGSPFFRWDGTTASASRDVTGGDGAFAHIGTERVIGSAQNGRFGIASVDASGEPVLTADGEKTPCLECGQLFINPMAVDPHPGERYLFYPTGSEMWRYDTDWETLDSLALPAGFGFSALSLSTSPAGVLYYAAYSASDPPRIFRLDNAETATGGQVERSIPGADAGSYVLHIAVNPEDADEILVAISNYSVESLYHSSDGGQSYTAVEGNLSGTDDDGPSIRTATILPLQDLTLYLVGTSVGAFSTSTLFSSYTTWRQVAFDVMGNTAVGWVDSRPSDGRIAIATHGRGIFVGAPSTGIVVEDEVEIPTELVLRGAYPNPFNPTTNIQFDLPEQAEVSLQVINMLGRRVFDLPARSMAAGTNRHIHIDAGQLSSGTYLYRVIADMAGHKVVGTGTFVLLK